MNTIKCGIAGIGRIGIQHCRTFSQDRERYTLVAVCDLEADRVSRATAAFGGTGYTDFAAFLADPAMELVILATRSLDHARGAAQALAAGKIVLLEKPIGVTAEDFALLERLLKQYPGRLYFGHNHRFEPAFVQTQAFLATGLLGNIHTVKLQRHHRFMRRNDWQSRLDCGGGQLSVWGPHLIDQGLQLLGAPVRSVWSHLQRLLTPGDADDQVRILLLGENDTRVELEISYAAAIAGPYCTIHGDRGTLQYEQDQKNIQLRYLEPSFVWPKVLAETQTPAEGKPMNADPPLPWVDETRKVEPDTSLWEQVEIELARHLFQAIRQQVPFPIRSADAMAVVRITEIVKKQNPQFAWIG